MHVVEESISVLKLMLIGSVEDKVINMSNHLEQEIREARTIMVLFSRLNTLIGELNLPYQDQCTSMYISKYKYKQ